jgi:hypothetical protein
MAGKAGPGSLVIERILRDREGIWQQIIGERELGALTRQMLVSSAISLALYGAVLGASNSWQQALSSFVKLPLLFLATLAICLPTLYLFNLVFGARLSVMQALTLIMVCITVTSTLTLAFAPISLFFLVSAHSYQFFKLLNVAILVMTAVVGLKFLTSGMRALNAHQDEQARLARLVPVQAPVQAPAELTERTEPAEKKELVPAAAPTNGTEAAFTPLDAMMDRPPIPQHPHHPQHPQNPQRPWVQARPTPPPRTDGTSSMSLLYIWIVLFGFVGTQLAWTLRPFFGDPDQRFSLFRHIEGTFYADIFRTIGHLISGG